MVSNGKNNKGPVGKIVSAIISILVIVLVSVILVTSGAWDKFASHIPGLNTVGTSVEGIKPHGSDYDKIGLNLQLQKPSLPDINTGSTQQPATGNAAGNQPALQLPAGAASPITSQQALDIANTLTVATPHTSGFNREKQFGDWANSPDMCGTATTRDVILARDLTNVAYNSKCKVQSGDFTDPYTGTSMTFKYGTDTSSLIQIDHVVAVYEAYASGLWDKDQQTRVNYYNDPEVLLASQGEANNRKSEGANLKTAGVPTKYAKEWKNSGEQRWAASTPSIWLPSYQPYQCQYMSKRMYVKNKYALSMSPWEKTETVDFLTQCVAKGN